MCVQESKPPHQSCALCATCNALWVASTTIPSKTVKHWKQSNENRIKKPDSTAISIINCPYSGSDRNLWEGELLIDPYSSSDRRRLLRQWPQTLGRDFATGRRRAHRAVLQNVALRIQHQVPGVSLQGARLTLEAFLPPPPKFVQLDNIVIALARIERRSLFPPLLVHFVSLLSFFKRLQNDL